MGGIHPGIHHLHTMGGIHPGIHHLLTMGGIPGLYTCYIPTMGGIPGLYTCFTHPGRHNPGIYHWYTHPGRHNPGIYTQGIPREAQPGYIHPEVYPGRCPSVVHLRYNLVYMPPYCVLYGHATLLSVSERREGSREPSFPVSLLVSY